MQITLGKKGLDKTWQETYEETISCYACGGKARIGFVAHEGFLDHPIVSQGPFVCSLHKNKGKHSLWLHDCCTVAIYFCQYCLAVSAEYNQA